MSNRDKIIFIFLLVIALALAVYFIPYKRLAQKETALKNEVAGLDAKYSELTQEMLKKDEYLKGIEDAKTILEDTAAALPQALTQERLIAIVNDMENVLDIQMPSIELGSTETLFTFEDPNAEGANEVAIKNTVSSSSECTYNQLKDLLNYVNYHKDRIVLNELQIASDPKTGLLGINYSLSFFGLSIDGREEEVINLGEFPMGKNIVFEPFEAYGEKFNVSDSFGQTEENSADFSIRLHPYRADTTTTLIGKTDNPSSFIYDERNSIVDNEIIFYQEDNTYYYQYKVGETSYPKDYISGVAFDPGLVLEIAIFSSDRFDDDDVSGINATIFNKTDMPVNIVYRSEDKLNPRFNIVHTEGDVIIH